MDDDDEAPPGLLEASSTARKPGPLCAVFASRAILALAVAEIGGGGGDDDDDDAPLLTSGPSFDLF